MYTNRTVGQDEQEQKMHATPQTGDNKATNNEHILSASDFMEDEVEEYEVEGKVGGCA